MKRILCLALVAFLVAGLALPAHAADSGASWIELLETATVNDSGNNIFTFSGTAGTFSVKTPEYMRLTKIDLVLTHPSGYAPSSVRVRYNNIYYSLTLAKIDAYTTRAYGANIPDSLYADVFIQINKSVSSSCSYQILSCKVSPFVTEAHPADGYATINGSDYIAPFAFSGENPEAADVFDHYQFRLALTDWQKYDRISINGSVGIMALNSIRATVAGIGVPYEMTYAQSNASGAIANDYTWNNIKYYSYDGSYQGTSETTTIGYTEYKGKVLFTMTLDLSHIDRNLTDELLIYFVGLANEKYGYTIQFQQIYGYIDTADVTNASWWYKFTKFFTDLFAGDQSGANQFANDMNAANDQIQSANDSLDSVERPDVEEVPLDPSEFLDPDGMIQTGQIFQQLLGNDLVMPMVSISLVCGLAAFIIF